MQEKLTVYLGEDGVKALQELSRAEMRPYNRQAALIIKQELVRRGLLQAVIPNQEKKTNDGQIK